jgi:ubiquinone/menaquinone biosynthesis C-methylase UbiE
MVDAEEFYDESAQEEWERLERHRTEFAVTIRAFRDYLPAPACAVLDIGGGPGRYSIELAKLGYSVTLLDLSSKSLKFAQEKAKEAQVDLEAVIHSNALDLSEIESNTFAAVLLMGPLYHLLAEAERSRAVQEAKRVLKPGGVLCASFITRFAPYRYAASDEPEWLVDNQEYAFQLFKSGVHDQTKKFAKAFFIHPDEVVPLMESCGLETQLLLGCEGIVAGHETRVNELRGEAWEVWVEMNYQIGQEPSLFGAADHLLYIGRKQG